MENKVFFRLGLTVAVVTFAMILSVNSQACAPPCRNGGTCEYRNRTSNRCLCEPMYYGRRCQYTNPCVMFSYCENGGSCTNFNRQDYECSCPEGFAGDRCQYKDACVDSPCEGHRRCENIWPSSYKCVCGDGYYGENCTEYNMCHDDPCLNGGKCTHLGSYQYECNCASDETGFDGQNCENYDFCLTNPCPTQTSKCVNDSTSQEGFKCDCYPGFYGRDCLLYDRCLLAPCRNNGTCESRDDGDSYLCHCPPQYEGDMCNDVVYCEAESTVSLKGSFLWPSATIGDEVTLPCPTGDGEAVRTCNFIRGKPKWSLPNTSLCLNTELNTDVAGDFTSQLATNTEDASDMIEEELQSAVELLSAVVEYSFSNLSIAKDVMRCVSNVLDVDLEVMARSDTEENTSQELLSIIKSYGEQAVMENTTIIDFREANMRLHLRELNEDEISEGVEFEEEGRNQTKMKISLPPEALKGSGGKTRVRFTAMHNGKLFLEDPKRKEENRTRYEINPDDQMIIAAELASRKINGLNQTVNYSVSLTENGQDYRCVFWNETGNVWATYGLDTLALSGDNFTVECTSSHLTYFAVLLDTGFSNVVPTQHVVSLTVISYVGSIISMIGLVATFLTYSLFRSLRKQPSGKLLINLCASLFLLNLIFILDGTGSITGTDGGCKIAAILLHYFVLTTFLWMGAEAISIYRSLVEVFQGNRSSYYVCKCCIFAWGGAVIPIGIVLAIDVNLYTRHQVADVCLLTPENLLVYYFLYLAPCSAVLVANMIVFILVLRAVFACNKQVHHNSARLRRTQVGCALSITFLLGLTWLFGFFAISEATLPFQYVFCILNSLQGFFIFLFRCALYPEAVRAWRMCWKMRTLSVDRHINSSLAQKHSSQHHGENSSSSSSKNASKNKHNTKVTFASSDSNKTSFRWLRRNDCSDGKSGKNTPFVEKYIPKTSTMEGANNNASTIEYPFRLRYQEENNV